MGELVQVGPNRYADITLPQFKHLKAWTPPATATETKAPPKASPRLQKFLLPVTACRTKPENMTEGEIEEEVQYLRIWLTMEAEEKGVLSEIQRLHKSYAIARLEVLTGEPPQ